MTVWISLAALCISAAALYLAVLRRAHIEADVVAHTQELFVFTYSSSDDAYQIPHPEVRVALFVSNWGAGSGVLERLEATRVEYFGGTPKLWREISNQYVSTRGSFPIEWVSLPKVLRGGDGDTIWLGTRCTSNPEARESADAAREFATGLGRLRQLRVHIEWRFARSRAPGWSFVPPGLRPSSRATETKKLVLEVDGAGFRRETVAHWRSLGDDNHAELVALAD